MLVTGASSGIGEATVRLLAGRGFETIAAARRLERCQELAKEVGGTAVHLDVTDPESVERMANSIERLDAIVHCAGGALDLDHLGGADLDVWREMYESNVLGLARVTQSLLDRLERSPAAHIVIVGSVAGVEVYPGGGGYTAAKHAVNAARQDPQAGAARDRNQGHRGGTRFGRDRVLTGPLRRRSRSRAKEVYRGLDPLTAEDVAEVIVFALERPAHVNIDYVAMKPVAQASAMITRRRSED